MTCVDEKGCILEHCTLESFNAEYRTLIDLEQAKQGNCPYILGSTRMQNLRADQETFQAVPVASCQPDIVKFTTAYANVAQAEKDLDLNG